MMMKKMFRRLALLLVLVAAPMVMSACDLSGSTPVTAAFYYGWYPSTWYSDEIYDPSAGQYDERVNSVVDRQIADAKYAGIQAFIASWWGVGTVTDNQLPTLLSRADAAGSFSVMPYYEKEGYSNPSVSELQTDLSRLHDLYELFPDAFATVDGKPVVFVYNANDTTCDVADRWKLAAGSNWYVNLKVFVNRASCTNQPDSWHQYNPAVHSDHQAGYSYTISPGWWLHGASSPALARDTTRWANDVQAMKNSTDKWHLITTYNEWGEASSTESSPSWSSSGGHGYYMDVLHLWLNP